MQQNLVAKYSLFIALLLSAVASMFAEPVKDGLDLGQKQLPDITLSVSTSLGRLYGAAQEFVYVDGYKLSELDWSFKPMVYWGTRLALTGFGGGFEASIDFKSGFNGFSGTITDSDFLNGDGVKTHYSIHDCYTERAILFDLKAGWAYKASPAITLTFKGSVMAMDFKWSARDGYLQYPPELSSPYTPWSANVAKDGIVGTGILYTQNYLALGAALGLRIIIDNGWEAMVGLGYSPLVYCNDVDNHLFTGVDYYETMSGGFIIEPEAALSFAINPKSRLILDASYRLAKGLVGDTKMIYTRAHVNPGTTYIFKNGGGAAYYALDMALSYELSL
jgi:outer membrane protease